MTVKDATVPTPPALLIAAHGTRLAAGKDAARALTALVARKLPDIVVKDAFIELTDPPLGATVAELAASGPLVVVPLMLGAGGHLRDDIPEAIDAAPVGARIALADHLGPDPRLRAAVRERIGEVLGDWAPDQTAVVFLGRGCSVPDANADHTRLGRMLWEEGGYAYVTDAFIQVASPTLAEGLSLAYSTGARKIVVAPHYLFPGLLENWAHDQSARWAAEHPDAEVRVAPIIGAGDALADVVIDRYRAAAAHLDEGEGSPVYLSGLDLRARRVLVAGAGRVATRRISRLLEVDADVTVVAPEASGRVTAWAAAGALTWERRTVEPADVDGAWYVLAATDSAQANAAVAAAAERTGTFCVRADDATGGSAWTPATGVAGPVTVGVVGRGNPRLSASLRDVAVRAVAAVGAVSAGGARSQAGASGRPSYDYRQQGSDIYAESFRIIRDEADLSALPVDLEPVAVRMIHAAAQTDLAASLAWSPGVAAACRDALRAGAPILCDASMVATGVIRSRLPADNEVVCHLGDPRLAALAAELGTTKTAAAVELWRERLDGAVVAIGNAPTALFRLLEVVRDTGVRPAAVIGIPVGFVGAAESKQALAENPYGLEFLTVLGRRGGSALTVAAINALASAAETTNDATEHAR